MHTKKLVINCLILFLGIITLRCKDNGVEPDSEPEIIPLDGRGGGVIAYCYQPLQNGIHQIYGINADGSGNRKIIEAGIGLNHYDWSPDGQKLAAVGYVDHQTTWSIYVVNSDGTNLIRLTSTVGVWDNDPAWSPDGSQIVFARVFLSENNRSELWIMDSDGSNQHSIGVEGFAAKWSPDGTNLVYQSKFVTSSDIYTCNPDGSNVQQLTSTAFSEITPVYSPDGTQIAYVTDRDGNHEIYLMNADGTNSRRLTNIQYEDYAPRWSHDGSMIAFNSGPFQEWEIYIINADGTNLRQVTNSPAGITAINPVWKPVNQ